MDVIAAARAWLAEDPDPETRAALAAALEADDRAALDEWFGARLAFGTAGMRGAMGPGPNRMNRALVRRVTAGLAAALPGPGPVVVGYDGRRGSPALAAEAVAVLLGAGRPVWRFDRVCPTPELAHAVLALGAAAGVMITASHNPPADNGYKVYAANGAQIVPPLDGAISAAIDRLGALADIPLGHDGAKVVPTPVRAAYVSQVLGLRVHREGGAPRAVYTAMHGVGRDLLTVLLSAAGRGDRLVPVPAQADPDGRFPTVAFPNPEEPGALDLALKLAKEVDADVVLANDPDADRIAVAVPDRGNWRVLTGNQVGCLLAEDLLAHGPPGRRMVATTVVSSRMLARIAADHGAAYAETLTGFKWIANAGIPFDAAGGRFVLGYEEALGVSAGGVVRDKDGISAALLVLDLVAWLALRGETLLDALIALYRRHGLHASGQRSLVFPGRDGQAHIRGLMAGLRAAPPASIAGIPVAGVRDLAAGSKDLPPSDVLGFDLADGSVALVRPSGTEPKIKLYVEVREPMGDEPLHVAEARAAARLSDLASHLGTHLGTS
jgi:phosphomannomutase